MSIESPILFCIAVIFMAAMIGIALWRRDSFRPLTGLISILLGAAMLALAAGGAQVHLPDERSVLVMVDRSPSMRGAAYQDRAAIEQRVGELLGGTPHQILEFSSPSAERTVYAPPPADAILLFSDARFDKLPRPTAPTYVVVDPKLENPVDAAVVRIAPRGQRAMIEVRNNGAARSLQVGEDSLLAATGEPTLTAPISSDSNLLSARLAPGDDWPENDALSLQIPPPPTLERWWIGDASTAPPGWRAMRPADLPTDIGAYLSTSAVVLNNIPVDSIPLLQRDCLAQFVRDSGGGIVLVGGDRAFAAGGYTGTVLDQISPLASSPPQPQRNWVLLVDASGSMATASADDTVPRWQRAAGAVAQLIKRLPPNDPVSVGSFAADLRWWSQGSTAAATARMPMPPKDISPGGPTNLQNILIQLMARIEPRGRTEIIVISDAQTSITDPAALAQLLREHQSRLSLLGTAPEAATSPLLRVVVLTGGNFATQVDPKLWSDAAVKLLRSTMPDRLEHQPAAIAFTGALGSLPGRTLNDWNRTWLKQDATELASATVTNEHVAMAAHWRVGIGQVAAAGFPAAPAEVEAMAGTVAREPTDPRFKVSWDTGSPSLRVTVDAADNDRPMNDLDLLLTLNDQPGGIQNVTTYPIPQTAPGRYEASIPAPRTSVLASVRPGDQRNPIDQIAVAGRYPAEFEAMGNDHAAMQSLARLSGGSVIAPAETSPIDLHWPARTLSIVSALALTGTALIALGMIIWKIRGGAR